MSLGSSEPILAVPRIMLTSLCGAQVTSCSQCAGAFRVPTECATPHRARFTFSRPRLTRAQACATTRTDPKHTRPASCSPSGIHPFMPRSRKRPLRQPSPSDVPDLAIHAQPALRPGYHVGCCDAYRRGEPISLSVSPGRVLCEAVSVNATTIHSRTSGSLKLHFRSVLPMISGRLGVIYARS
jgi:hypothetical protein